MREPKRERRKVAWAILASLIVHFVVAFSLAAFGSVFTPETPIEDKPAELTFVDLATPPPLAQKNTPFMETDESRKSAQAPQEKTFESNENSIGASERPANGDAPVPTQEGKDRPHLDMDTRQFSLATEGGKPQPPSEEKPTPAPSQSPKTTPTPAATATPPDQLAMLTSTPTPPPTAAPSATPEQSPTPMEQMPTPAQQQPPQPPASSYRRQEEQTRSLGRITNRGRSAVNAVGTPLGKYQKTLYDAIGARWYFYTSPKQQGDLINIGTAQIQFWVDRSGHVKNLKIVQNTSNEAFANVCLRSVLEVQVPPIPEEVAGTLPSEGLYTEISFTMYGNQ
jgi:outer membrane biosynthesis protein TonB